MPKKAATQANILLYGAYGYTGELIAELARNEGISLTLCGRNKERLAVLSNNTGHQFDTVDLADPIALRKIVGRHKVVLHCAGPFEDTFQQMTDACLDSGVHYLDITGEAAVFAQCLALDDQAQKAGICIMPGTGFDVVPSDCLAMHLHKKMPSATSLELGFSSRGGGVSHGTATTMIRNLGEGGAERIEGQLQSVPLARKQKTIDFGFGIQDHCATIPWGDIVTAYHSTNIPNISVYTKMSVTASRLAKASFPIRSFLGSAIVRNILQNRVDNAPAGPSEKLRSKSFSVFWGSASGPQGQVEAVMKTPEGYTLTAMTALDIAQIAASGQLPSGYQTPSSALGSDYILKFKNVERIDR